jgi:hypothetical protein
MTACAQFLVMTHTEQAPRSLRGLAERLLNLGVAVDFFRAVPLKIGLYRYRRQQYHMPLEP